MLRSILVAMVLSGLVFADFTDDFESYSPGDDIEASSNWEKQPDGGQCLVVQNGTGNAAEACFNDSTFIGYVCTAADFWADGSVAMDISPQGAGSFSGVYARLNVMGGGSYTAGLTIFSGSYTYAYIAYANSEGGYDLLYSEPGPEITPGSSVNVKLDVEGNDPVVLSLFIDGEKVVSINDNTYLLDEGICGFVMFYNEEEPEIIIDNFEVTERQQSLRSLTFGALKALFR